MELQLHLELLGGARITRGGVPLHFVTAKAVALLCYLAVTGRPHSRTSLAALLWGEHAEDDARRNLRVVLTNLRHLVAPHLLITRETLAFDQTSTAWLDVEAFEAALRGAVPPDLDRLGEAVALYRGDFLEGFHVRNAPAFEEWALAQRERQRQRVLHALHVLVNAHIAQHAYAAGIEHCTRLLQLDPWGEDAHRQLMLLLVSSGQPGAALAQYETCRRLLEDELGVQPSPETTALYERLLMEGAGRTASPPEVARAAEPLPPVEPPRALRSNLPSPHTSFVGRDAELAQITARLREPACRLLTLAGPGGIGKTRLALSVAASLSDAFADGVYFVPLAPTSAPQYMAAAIAGALGYAQAEGDPAAVVLHHLRGKTLLLVLDNVEHLLAGADLLLEILAAAPAVKLLVTSRERLALQAEHLLDIRGLPYPPATPDGAAAYDAVRLFVDRARQARADFALSADNAPSIARICRLVEGMPLGLELAATWIRTHTCQEIATELADSLDFLATSLRDHPERHRSLRAVFDHSWHLLAANEQAILPQLAIFRGGFLLEAAHAVVGAPRAALIGLVDKSLLRRTRAGRYEMHPLVSQYAEERLAALPEDDAAAHARHCDYVAAFLEAQERALKGAGQDAALAAIAGEIHNVRAAWQWAAAHGRVEPIGRMLDGLCLFYTLRSWVREGDTATAQAVQGLAAVGDLRAAPVAGVVARLLAWRARFCHLLGRYAETDRLVEQSLALAQGRDLPQVRAVCVYIQGCNAGAGGDYARAGRLFQESLALYRDAGDQFGAAELLTCLGGVAYDQGGFVEARRWWEEACAVCRGLGDRNGLARLLNNLAEAARFLGEYAEARRQSEESLALLHDIGHGWQLAGVLYNLGAVAQCEGRSAEARQRLGASLQLARQLGRPQAVGLALLELVWVALDEGALDEAQALAEEALKLYQGIGHRRGTTYSLGLLARVGSHRDDAPAAKRLAEESLAIAREIGDKMAIGAALRTLGRAERQLGLDGAAEQTLDAALGLLVDIRVLPEALDVIVEQAELLVRRRAAGEMVPSSPEEDAAALLAVVLGHPAAWQSTRVRAEQLQANLHGLLSPEARALTQHRAREISLEVLAADRAVCGV